MIDCATWSAFRTGRLWSQQTLNLPLIDFLRFSRLTAFFHHFAPWDERQTSNDRLVSTFLFRIAATSAHSARLAWRKWIDFFFLKKALHYNQISHSCITSFTLCYAFRLLTLCFTGHVLNTPLIPYSLHSAPCSICFVLAHRSWSARGVLWYKNFSLNPRMFYLKTGNWMLKKKNETKQTFSFKQHALSVVSWMGTVTWKH